jgi:hypothetical protein
MALLAFAPGHSVPKLATLLYAVRRIPSPPPQNGGYAFVMGMLLVQSLARIDLEPNGSQSAPSREES